MQEPELQAPAMEKRKFPKSDSSLVSQTTEKHGQETKSFS